jgi:hypothetical protein
MKPRQGRGVPISNGRLDGAIYLVTSHLGSNMVQCLNKSKAKLLTLLVCGHSNILDVADKA